jgi:hypothetical protein
MVAKARLASDDLHMTKDLGTQLLVIARLPGCVTPGSVENLDDIPAA